MKIVPNNNAISLLWDDPIRMAVPPRDPVKVHVHLSTNLNLYNLQTLRPPDEVSVNYTIFSQCFLNYLKKRHGVYIYILWRHRHYRTQVLVDIVSK